ncbi:oligosaccharide flippase family protein [Beduinella massiliensis]|uniref:oligosaccharide flippase family protein n=1 Tax=Beduinella massiliensis TaxID=1852363 RepID=UPI000C827BA1
MSKGKELVKNTGILFIGKISTQFVSFLLLPLYTAKLTTEAYGTLDLYTTIGSILIPFLSLQLEQAIFRYLLTAEEDDRTVLSTTTVFLLLSSIIMTVVYLPLTQVVELEYSVLVLLYYISLLFSTVFFQVPRGYGNNTLYTVVSFSSTLVSIAFAILFICGFNTSIEGVLLARVISGLFTVVFISFGSQLFSRIRLRYFSFKCLKAMLKYSVPLVFNQIGSWVVNYSDRIIIIAVLGIGTNGVYAIANKFFSVITTTLNVYNMAWTESVTKALNDSERNAYYNRVFSVTVKLFVLVAAGITAGVGVVFKYFINESYGEAYNQIPILVYAAMFSGLCANVGSIYIAHKKTKEISSTTLFTAVINLAVHFGLIKFVGLYAASISTLVAFCSMFIYRIIKLKNVEPLTVNVKQMIPGMLVSAVICTIYYIRIEWMQVVSLLVLAIYVVINMSREEVLKIPLTNLKNRMKK